MYLLKIGWSPIFITALAVAGYLYEWPVEALAPALVVILIVGLVVAAVSGKERELERSSLKLKRLAGYFNRRFAGNSSLSIFAIIDSLFGTDNPKLWEWARACDMARRVFNTWGDSFISRVESDIRTRRYTVYLHTYLNELWLINNHYYEFVEQFYEVADRVNVPPEAADQYKRFVMEYNAFVHDFRSRISELKKLAGTEIEPPSVKLAKELVVAAEPPPPPAETKPKLPQPDENKGYIM